MIFIMEELAFGVMLEVVQAASLVRP